jgi:hypothetical protein
MLTRLDLSNLTQLGHHLGGNTVLYKVRLELASCREFPNGNSNCGYELLLPLTRNHDLDFVAWRPRRTSVRRFWCDGAEACSELTHDREDWYLTFGNGLGRDEAFLQNYRFGPGEDIPIIEFDGRKRVYRVVDVEPRPEA